MPTEKTLTELYSLKQSDPRFAEYKVYEQLYNGRHYDAFSIKSEDFKDSYSRLRYIVCNFAGLVSKISADFLFGEPVKFMDDKNQDFIDKMVFEHRLDTLFYEHALANSYFGDNLFKIRVKDNQIIPGSANPQLYLPEIDEDDANARPSRIYLAWEKKEGDDTYFIVEMHEPPYIKTRVGIVNTKKQTVEDMDLEVFNDLFGTSYIPEVNTKISRFTVIHVPNPKPRGHFGNSDYADIRELMFALNNRMSKVDNILDKHSDPILAVPEDVLDDENKIRAEALQMFEMDESGNKPEYIVWNASLDNAFKQIDKMVEFLFMFSETSPDVLGLGKGQAESGRALKMRLLRTIAKRNRKKLYYDPALKDLIFTAEVLSAQNGYFISDSFKKVKATSPELPETRWEDGVVNDEVERVDIAVKKTEAKLMSKKRAIMDLEGVKEDEADEIIKEIDDESADFTSFMDGNNNPFSKDSGKDDNQDDKQTKK